MPYWVIASGWSQTRLLLVLSHYCLMYLDYSIVKIYRSNRLTSNMDGRHHANQQPLPAFSTSATVSYLEPPRVDYLSDEQKNYLLQKYGLLHPDLGYEIALLQYEQYQRKQAAEQKRLAKVCDFDHYSKSIWHILNTDYDGPRGYREYDAFGDAEAQIRDRLDSMRAVIGKHPNFGT